MPTLDALTPIFRQVFDDDSIVLTRETSANDIDAWDSLSHMNLIVSLEVHYKIKFALGELQKLKNVGDLADLVDKKLARK
ncbi:hypothetical protein GeomeDRAFT_1901 [Geobacter metallireducens RCH3]|uniref:Acyl carrier protein n=2 Tax=Geobacter metallireducens (strain ATCC 53774 / DSM 7210 / GS-15) TaxID=269799 RepID=Q39T60_GEOMG|nr:acyl carrier protein [Geobacter metallireducens]ABB32564.1 acyl carrier protein [Geobacter metallireducens GS-15]EHP86409.1 hypothetical protein GeomeDRAFT_1901 [Geobacter metallireducens RCH3]